MQNKKIQVHYIDHMGEDLTPVNAARISFGMKKEKMDEKDEKLTKYLAKHQHYSPFEHCTISLMIECPLYVRSQIMRHRTFAYNEISRRYTDKDMEFYLPEKDDLRTQSENNKQCSDGPLDETLSEVLLSEMECHQDQSLKLYNRLVDAGVSREQARGVLPQDLMTSFYMTGNLRNWCHFLKLRLGKDAQKEVQYVAKGVEKYLKRLYPVSYNALMEE